MARSYLTTKHEMWLCENFASKSNQELVSPLPRWWRRTMKNTSTAWKTFLKMSLRKV